MKLRFIVSSLALVTVFGLSTQAQELPKIDASVSYSYLRANPATSGVGGFNLNGGSASASYHFRDWLGGVADFGGYHLGSRLVGHGANRFGNIRHFAFPHRVCYRVRRGSRLERARPFLDPPSPIRLPIDAFPGSH